MFKKILTAVIFGAATALGSILMNKGVDALEQPTNRAKIKKAFENIKKKLRFKGEYQYYQETRGL